MQSKTEKLLHVLIIISTAAAIAAFFMGAVDALGSTGTACFRYFTTDSNVLALIASVLCLVYSKRGEYPTALRIFRFTAVTAVSITLLTVIFFLAPMAALRGRGLNSVMLFFRGNVFVLHVSTPVLSIIALMLDKHGGVSKRQAMWAISPVVIYSLVYVVNVVILKIWKDWYGFTFGGRYYLSPIVMVVMYLFTAAVALILHKVKEKTK